LDSTLTENQLFKFAKTLKVLYVEDSLVMREIADGLLCEVFNEIVFAIDGLDGLKKFDNSIDLIITDIDMPNMDGIEMLKKIKEINRFTASMVISSHDDASSFTKTIDIGIDGYALKPISYDSLIASIMKVLEKIYLRKELYKHKLMLGQKVSDQIKELQEKDDTLMQQSRLAIMGEMIDIVAHQWKQPLNVIASNTEFLSLHSNDGINVPIEDVIECEQEVNKQIKHLITTIDEFRSFLRPNTNMSVCNLSKMFESLEILLKDTLHKESINLNISCDANIDMGVNENEIKHIFIDMINNSKDAFNIKNIREKQIDISVTNQQNQIKIVFQDNAGGIPEEIIKNIFKSNFTTKTDSGGTGMGLYMSELIANKYGMSLSVENKNNGACFTLMSKE
jgi:signal transduction histidine kinase